MSGGFGAFGKIPSVGDFFRVNVPNGFVSAWDAWIQSAMLTVQARLGGEWDARYMSAPIWRFSLSPGLAGPYRTIGVLMPSVDRVGRRFPLTLMSAPDTAGTAAQDHFQNEAVFSALESVALDALDDGMTKESLSERLADIPQPTKIRAVTAFQAQNGSLVAQGGAGSGGVMPGLVAAFLSSRANIPSLWSTLVDDTPRLLVCNGLPQGEDMHGLFDLTAPVWNGGGSA